MELRKVDGKNIWEIVRLSVAKEQSDFVATNTESLLEAYTTITSGGVALPFGIYDGARYGVSLSCSVSGADKGFRISPQIGRFTLRFVRER